MYYIKCRYHSYDQSFTHNLQQFLGNPVKKEGNNITETKMGSKSIFAYE